jgi:hypothetical protein
LIQYKGAARVEEGGRGEEEGGRGGTMGGDKREKQQVPVVHGHPESQAVVV